MPKTDINKIVKKGAVVKYVNVDYSTKKKQAEIKELQKVQYEVLKRQEVDLQQLAQFVIKF